MTSSAATQAQVQDYKFIHSNIYPIYEGLEHIKEFVLQYLHDTGQQQQGIWVLSCWGSSIDTVAVARGFKQGQGLIVINICE